MVRGTNREGHEEDRLRGLFQALRSRLLDLTLRNPMLNYKPQANSRRHIRLVDDAPEDVYARLSDHSLLLKTVDGGNLASGLGFIRRMSVQRGA